MPDPNQANTGQTRTFPSHRVEYVLDERRRAALAAYDRSSLSLFHPEWRIFIVASVGFFTTAYDIFAVNILSVMLGYDLGIKVATPIGTLIGQLLFGRLADVVGHGIELLLAIIATIGQALAGSGHAINIFPAIIIWRFVLGIGLGGDYPLSAIICSEFAATRIRGRVMTAMYSAQGWGNLASALTGLALTVAFKNSILLEPSSPSFLRAMDQTWRLLVGLGCVPAAFALYLRLTMPETPRFLLEVERRTYQGRVQHANTPRASWADFRRHFGQWKNLKLLVGASYSWFALDLAFYGLGLNVNIVITALGFGAQQSNTAYQSLRNVCIGNIILAGAGLIPGYWMTFLFIDSWGRKPIQLMGFTALFSLFLILGFAFDRLRETHHGIIIFTFLYCLVNFFQNFGPNVTTFVIPAALFPTRYRSTAHGICAACGKLGAIFSQLLCAWQLGAYVNSPTTILNQNQPPRYRMKAFAFVMLSGVLSTLLLPETKGKTLEELTDEDQEGYFRCGDSKVSDPGPDYGSSSMHGPADSKFHPDSCWVG
ncbi:major facilitator superfamily domain-containing protein [Infundibulicybe gibba]|nr:major facilitator superfamily domain-containing protein [Infundibulicybe gibba]